MSCAKYQTKERKDGDRHRMLSVASVAVSSLLCSSQWVERREHQNFLLVLPNLYSTKSIWFPRRFTPFPTQDEKTTCFDGLLCTEINHRNMRDLEYSNWNLVQSTTVHVKELGHGIRKSGRAPLRFDISVFGQANHRDEKWVVVTSGEKSIG